MQKIIKPRSPSRQLLETVNFAFMKIFDSLVKIAVFRASLLFWEIPVMHFFPEPSTSGLEKTAPSGELEFSSRSN